MNVVIDFHNEAEKDFGDEDEEDQPLPEGRRPKARDVECVYLNTVENILENGTKAHWKQRERRQVVKRNGEIGGSTSTWRSKCTSGGDLKLLATSRTVISKGNIVNYVELGTWCIIGLVENTCT